MNYRIKHDDVTKHLLLNRDNVPQEYLPKLMALTIPSKDGVNIIAKFKVGTHRASFNISSDCVEPITA